MYEAATVVPAGGARGGGIGGTWRRARQRNRRYLDVLEATASATGWASASNTEQYEMYLCRLEELRRAGECSLSSDGEIGDMKHKIEQMFNDAMYC